MNRPSTFLTLSPGLFGMLLLAGCGDGVPGTSGTVAVSDSAGIEIVANPGEGQWDEGQEWRVREVVRLGGVDGPEETLFERPGDMVPDGQGGVFVVEAGEMALRRYGPDGTFLGRMGGAGEGPGEFGSLNSAVDLGDTLLVLDVRNRRISRFLKSGELLDTQPLELDTSTQGFPMRLIPLADGRLIMPSPQGCAMPPPEDPRAAGRLNVTLPPSPDEHALTVEGPITRWVDHATHAIYGERICSVRPSLAGHGIPLAVRTDGVAAVAPGPEYDIHIFRVPDGAESWAGGALDAFPPPERIIRRAVERRPVTADDRRDYRESRRPTDLTDPMSREVWEAIEAALDTTRVPDRYPAIQELVWDDQGHLWVQRRGAWDEPDGPWDVFDPEGRYLGEVALPEAFTVRLIHEGRIWGTATGEFDVQELVSLEIEGR